MTNHYDLPYLAEIFSLFLSGKHISDIDGDIYQAIRKKPSEYESLFAALGYTMVSHTREFYYFTMKGKGNTDIPKQMGLFVFVFIENLDRKSNNLEQSLLTERFDIEELPHLTTERYRDLMAEVKVTDKEKLVSVIESLQKYGFAKLNGPKTHFEFLTPVYRFVDQCNRVLDNAESEVTTETEEARL